MSRIRRAAVGAAIIAGLLLAGAAGIANDTACDLKDCISLSKLSSKIAAKLHGKVVGFVSMVGDLPPIAEGQARTSVDPPQTAMASDLPINIASVTKVLTTIAVLQSLGQHQINIDAKISPYLYSDWNRGPNIDGITFHMLLNHTSGFREQDCDTDHQNYAALKDLIAQGVDASRINVVEYSNCNFAIFREMLPQMEGSPLGGPDSARAQQSADFYIAYMNQHVFQPVGISPRACRPPTNATAVPGYAFPVILSYPNPAGSAPGEDWGDWTLACGAGGWVLSASDVFTVVKDVAGGGVLLSQDERTRLMASNPNCISWDCTVRPDCPNPSLCKNGSLVNKSGKIDFWTYAAILKCTVPVVVIVNSALPQPYEQGTDITGLVEEAQDKAKVPGPGSPCP